MKTVLFAVAGLGVGGAAYVGADAPDFDGMVRMSRPQVYAAFSTLAPEGITTAPATDELGHKVSIRVRKENGESLRYEILFDDDPVVTADLNFEEAGDAQTRLTAELDINAYKLGSSFQMEAGLGLAMVPDSVIDEQFAELMREMVGQIETGRPLQALGLERAGVRRQNEGESLSERRSEAARARRAAVAPMTRAEPTVDPNRAAENYLSGEGAGGWGR